MLIGFLEFQEALYGSAVQVGSNNNLSQSGFNVLAAGDTPRHTDAMRYDRKKDKACVTLACLSSASVAP